MRVLALVSLTACAVPFVPTERGHIAWVGGRHGHYEKQGIPLDGMTCGEAYMHAVAGVPKAEDLMSRCSSANWLYGAGMLGFVAFPVAGIVTAAETDGTTSHVAAGTGIALGLASFAIGLAAGVYSARHLDEAVRAYNATVDTSLGQR
jgi:hypothetical protein